MSSLTSCLFDLRRSRLVTAVIALTRPTRRCLFQALLSWDSSSILSSSTAAGMRPRVRNSLASLAEALVCAHASCSICG